MKKIIAIIVEGLSDETVITTGLSHLLEDDAYVIQVFRGDLLTSDIESRKSTKSLVGDYVKKRILTERHLNAKDIEYIIQVVDIDEVFHLQQLNKFQILHKQRIEELCKTKKILNIPFLIYYMSSNLEDVLSGEKNCTDEEKEKISNDFAIKYDKDYEGFKGFFDALIGSKFNDYISSWDYIKNGANERVSNISYFYDLIEGKVTVS